MTFLLLIALFLGVMCAVDAELCAQVKKQFIMIGSKLKDIFNS